MSAKVASPVSPVHLAWAMAPAFTPRTINTMEDEGYRSSEDIEGKSFDEPEASMATSTGVVPYNKDPPIFYENTPPEPNFTDDNEPFVFGIFRAPSSSSSVGSSNTTANSPKATPMTTAPSTPRAGSACSPAMTTAVASNDQAKQTPTTGFAERFLPQQYDGESGIEDDQINDDPIALDVKKGRLTKDMRKKLARRRAGRQVHFRRQVPHFDPVKLSLYMLFAHMLPETFFLGKSMGDWREKFMPLKHEALPQLLRMLERNGEDCDYALCLVSRVRDETMPEVPSIVITDPEGREIVLAN